MLFKCMLTPVQFNKIIPGPIFVDLATICTLHLQLHILLGIINIDLYNKHAPNCLVASSPS